jgi:hypothetical protein
MLTYNRLRELLRYDPETGVFTCLKTRSSRAQAGSIAGSLDHYGYRNICIDGVDYKAHRLAWFYVTGEWPSLELDHQFGHPDDNRWSMLRLATPCQNKQNVRRHRDNRTGFKGVHFHKGMSKWCAQIMREGEKKYLGHFDSPEEAHAAYCKAASELHGKFARVA